MLQAGCCPTRFQQLGKSYSWSPQTEQLSTGFGQGHVQSFLFFSRSGQFFRIAKTHWAKCDSWCICISSIRPSVAWTAYVPPCPSITHSESTGIHGAHGPAWSCNGLESSAAWCKSWHLGISRPCCISQRAADARASGCRLTTFTLSQLGQSIQMALPDALT